jgi:glycosyltransferase involved in cell wall biosynthesis
VGTGPELDPLRAAYGAHAEFLGRASDADLESLLARCRALVVPSVEDFGIAAVEAQAAGRPVVAPRGGGHLETVIDGETGLLFPPGDEDALTEILRTTDFDRFSSRRLIAHAQAFSTERFQRRLRQIVDSVSRSQDAGPAPPSIGS